MKKQFILPDFELQGTDGIVHSARELNGREGTVVMFLSATCPFVLALEKRILELADEYVNKGISFVAICSNSDSYVGKGNSYRDICEHSRKAGYNIPYLYDFDQKVMELFGAVCTPEFFLFDKHDRLHYRGRFDDYWTDESKVTQRYLKDAIDNMLAEKAPEKAYVPSFGCAIKKSNSEICIDDTTALVLSKYISLFNDGCENILVNCLYGNVIEADEDLKTFLRAFKQPISLFEVSQKLNLPEDTAEVVRQLYELRFLVPPDQDEKIALRQAIEKRRGRVQSGSLVSILRINMSTDCNMRCKYCYMEKPTVQRGKDDHASTMSLGIALDAIDAFVDNAVDNGKRRLSIRYIGGEPLLNKDVLEKTMHHAEELCKKNNIYVTHLICTNGLLIDEQFIAFLKTFADAQVLISLDGVKEINDRVRVDAAQNGTFDRVIDKIKLLVKNDISFGVPAVVDSYGLRSVKQFIAELSRIGVKRIGINPPYKFDEDDCEFSTMDALVDGYFDTWREAKKLGIQISGKAYLPEWHAMHGHIANCEGMGRAIVVDPDGHVSLCDKIADNLGTIYNLSNVFKTDTYEHFAMRVKGNIKACEDCEVSYLCNGGCLAEARNSYNSDNLSGKHCEFIKKMAARMFKDFV